MTINQDPLKKTQQEERPLKNVVMSKREGDQIDSLDKSIDEYKKNALKGINITMILKPMIYSLVALIISFFLDVSSVPLLGNVSVNLAKQMFPHWNPGDLTQTLSLWWLPVVFYVIFLWYAYMAYRSLKKEIQVSGSYENIDRILEGYIGAVKGISTAIPLIGAAILLVSVKLGPEVFIGISIPFEIKALLVLAIGELFVIVFDEMGVAFNDIINGIKDMREKYFVRLQMENTNLMIKQIEETMVRSSAPAATGTLPKEELAIFHKTVESVANLSKISLENYRELSTVAKELNGIPVYTQELVLRIQALTDQLKVMSQTTRATMESYTTLAGITKELKNLPVLTDDMVIRLKSVTESLKTVSEGLSNPGTQATIKSLENIITKK